MSDNVQVFLIALAIAGACIGAGLLLDNAACGARWQDSGRQHDWSVMGGCRVANKNGRLIPASNIRDIQ